MRLASGIVLTIVLFVPQALAQEKLRLASTGATLVYKAPEKVADLGKVPLFVWMHGAGDTPANMFKFANQAPGNQKAVICSVGAKANGVWTQNDDAGIDEAIKILSAKYPIDSSNIWMCGFSAGGFMAYGRACRFPKDVRGIIIGGSGVHGSFKFPGNNWKASAYIIIGGKDMNKSEAVALHKKLKTLPGIESHYEEDPAMGHAMKPAQISAAYEWALRVMDKK